MSQGPARVHILISGMVQGVGFRFFVEQKAQDYRIYGFTRNLPDGRVEVVAEGEKGRLEELIRECHLGPASAQVSSVETVWRPYKSEFDRFSITF